MEDLQNDRASHLYQMLWVATSFVLQDKVKLLERKFYREQAILRGTWFHGTDLPSITTPPQSSPSTTGPLHCAAILAILELCTWLLDERCEVNQRNSSSTPLQCTIFGAQALRGEVYDRQENMST